MHALNGRLAESLGRALPAAALVGALALGAWLGAGWFVYFTTPPVVPAVPAHGNVTISAAVQTLGEAQVFGAPPAGGIALSTLNVKLKGVFAGTPGHAIINTGGRDQTAGVGTEIAPGVALDSVHPRHIILRRNGAFERVNLEERPLLAQATPPRPVAPAPGTPPAPAAQAPAVPPQPPAGPGARFQRPEPYAPVGDVPTESAAATPAKPPPQAAVPGLVVSSVPAGSLLERIGLQPGDVIKTVNGQPVANEGDVARALQNRNPLAPVNAEVVRGGATMPLTVSATTALRQ